MPTVYYPYRYRLDQKEQYLIWLNHEGIEGDGVLLDEAGCLFTFGNIEELQAFARRQDLSVDPTENSKPLNFDLVEHWLANARKTNIDCETFLDAWNLFSDLASTLQGRVTHIDNQAENKIYDKLLWGSNLPALTPIGKHYTPIWSKSEVSRMRNVLSKGIRLFRSCLNETTPAPFRKNRTEAN